MPTPPTPRIHFHDGTRWLARVLATGRSGRIQYPIRHDRHRSGRAFRHLANLTGLAAIIYRRSDGRAIDVVWPEDLGAGG